MNNILSENWHKYGSCQRHFVAVWDYIQRNKFRCYRMLRAYGSEDFLKERGVPPSKILDKIFQPFFNTQPTGQGTGLGLSLAFDIVTKGHGGTLEVESAEGAGSEFTITLPFKTYEG